MDGGSWSVEVDTEVGATICRSGDVAVIACDICGIRPKKGRVTCAHRDCLAANSERRKQAKRDAAKPPVPCAGCMEMFRPRAGGQVYCMAPECRAKAREASRAAQTERFARWYDTHGRKGARRAPDAAPLAEPTRDPWAEPPPSCGSHLPGAVLTLALDRAGDRSPIPHRHIRALHGVVSALLDRGHDANVPDFALLAADTRWSPVGWALYLRDDEDARQLAGRAVDVRYQAGPARLTLGPLVRLRTPAVAATARHRVRIEALTPVHIRHASGGGWKAAYGRPTAHALWSALTQALPLRLGIEIDPRHVHLEVVASQTEETGVPLGKIQGGSVVRGWSGTVTLDVSPATRWLLECAARVGLGGRTAFGFGRIVVRDVAAEGPVDGAPPDEREERVSDHAAAYAAQRLGTSFDEARAQLLAAAGHATFVSVLSGGAELWQAGDVRFVLRQSVGGRQRIVSVAFGNDPLRPEAAAPRGGASGRFYVTPYAVRRFIQRVRPDLGYEQARTRLVDLASAARRVGAYRSKGPMAETLTRPEVWRTPKRLRDGEELADSRVRLVVSYGPGEKPQVVTVLGRRA